jgi:hypothetical protein
MLPFVPSSIGDIVTVSNIVHSIYTALSGSMGASYEYQCLITELRSFEQALKIVDRAIIAAPPTGRDALNIAAEVTTCHELLKRFHDRIGSYQKLLGGNLKGVSWGSLDAKWVGASSRLTKLRVSDRKFPNIKRISYCS